MKTENQEAYSLAKYSEAKDQPVVDFFPLIVLIQLYGRFIYLFKCWRYLTPQQL